MALIHYVPTDPKINFMGVRRFFMAFSLVTMLASIVLIVTPSLNFGVDFRGGTLIEAKTTDDPADIEQLRRILGGLGLGEVTIQTFGAPDIVLMNFRQQEGGDQAQQEAVAAIRDALQGLVEEYRRVEAVGPTVGDELKQAGLFATILALLGIAIYVWVRFDLIYGGAALAALMHDVILVLGFYALTQIEFNLSTLAAVLTVAGYSINDTVVIFDRVREELRRFKKLPVVEVMNKAINATFSRTLLTSGTTLMALLALYIFGGEVIRGFAAGIILGIVVGTYSSFGFAVPLLLFSRLRPKAPEGEKPQKVKPAV